MTDPRRITAAFGVFTTLAMGGTAVAQEIGDSNPPVWTDTRADAVFRRTDSTGSGPIHPATVPPDLVRVSLVPWHSPSAATNPYSGWVVPAAEAHLFRLDVVFAGLVNPPGPIGGTFEPFRYGYSPVYGFLEINVDGDQNTGGELGPSAANRYLANVGRFGRLPGDGFYGRAVTWGWQIDGNFSTDPQYERSGQDFSLVLCGCFDAEVIEGGNGNGIFEAGETWRIRGDFFQRAGGYVAASLCYGGVSNTAGLYDPKVELRFSHSPMTNETTLTLVYALDNIGSGMLAGAPPEPYDADAGNQNSVCEALADLIWGVNNLNLSGPTRVLAERWRERQPDPYLDVTAWKVTALFGTSYAEPQDSRFVWTDTGFDEVAGDVDADRNAGPSDAALIRQVIAQLDAGPQDGEGTQIENGVVQIIDFGRNFAVYDINADGWIDQLDGRFYCAADYNMDGRLNISDHIGFQAGFTGGHPRADIDRNGIFDINDFLGFIAAHINGCP